VLSFLWIYILNYVKNYRYTYVLTLGFILITYSIVTALGGNGILSVLAFGIVLGNHVSIANLINKKISMAKLEKKLYDFQEELSFLLETFIFVFLGTIFSIALNSIILGVITSASFVVLLLIARTMSVLLSTFRSELSKYRNTIILLCAQGLTPATLVILALSYGIPLAGTFISFVTYVIIFTNVVTSIGSYFAHKTMTTATQQNQS
jgi:cell volume regulation protein A